MGVCEMPHCWPWSPQNASSPLDSGRSFIVQPGPGRSATVGSIHQRGRVRVSSSDQPARGHHALVAALTAELSRTVVAPTFAFHVDERSRHPPEQAICTPPSAADSVGVLMDVPGSVFLAQGRRWCAFRLSLGSWPLPRTPPRSAISRTGRVRGSSSQSSCNDIHPVAPPSQLVRAARSAALTRR